MECFIGMHCSWRLSRIRGFLTTNTQLGREKITKEIRAKLSDRGDALDCCLGRLILVSMCSYSSLYARRKSLCNAIYPFRCEVSR